MKMPQQNKVCHTILNTIDLIIANCPDDAVIVESGTYLGSTAAYIVNKLVEAGKTFTVHTIDNFKYDNINPVQREIDNRDGITSYEQNLEELGVQDYIVTHIGNSIEKIQDFDDGSVYCVFIDDQHEYGYVKEQIQLWLPKIIHGGLMIGDDYEGGVKQAFDEVFKDWIEETENGGCFIRL